MRLNIRDDMEEIRSRKNDKIVKMKKLGAEKAFRYEQGQFFGDGEKLLYEALKNGLQVTGVFTCGDGVNVPENVPVYSVPRELIDYMSPLKTAQKTVFSCMMPEWEKDLSLGGVILENVQDPGNVGTVIRTANAFDVGPVMLLGDCADIYNPKTVRAAMGAIFRHKVFSIEYDDLDKIKENRKLCAAALHSDSVRLGETDIKDAVFVIGNEGRGVTDKILEKCTEKVIIPISENCESLNAAAAATVILWEMRKIK